MTYNIRYIGKSSGTVLNMIRPASGVESFKGFFIGASGKPSNLCALKLCPPPSKDLH